MAYLWTKTAHLVFVMAWMASAFYLPRILINLAEAGDEPAAQAALAFRLALGREPGEAEQAAALGLIREHGLPMFCRALFNANEFVYVF